VSNDELIGMIATAALLGGVIGAVVASWSTAIRRRADALSVRRADAYAQWLAARVTLTRASLSFVSSFRALAVERNDSPNLPLRREEAQRTRTAWSDAVRELDRAEAALLVWSHDPKVRTKLVDLGRPTPRRLQEAIDGDGRQVRALFAQMHQADERAAEFAQQVAAGLHRPSSVGQVVRQSAFVVDRIVARWGRP
jgi:hypothetical protein